MTTKTNPSDLKTLPEGDRLDSPGQHGVAPPSSLKAKKRGLIWVVLLLIVAGIAGYAVWRAGHAIAPVRGQGGGGGGRGGGGGGRGPLGPVPVVLAKVGRSSIPVYLNGLGNVTAFYTVTVKSRVDGQL